MTDEAQAGDALEKSPMYGVQEAMGATFTSFWGWIWTESFGDVQQEHSAIRHGAGAADVSSLIVWECTGPEALAAAQRLCTNNILGLVKGQLRYGAFLNNDGKMIDDATVFRLDDERVWVMTNRWHDLQEHFSQVTHGLDVTITDITLEMPLIQVQGPQSRDLVSKLTSVDLTPLKYFRFIPEQIEVAGVPVWISRSGFTGELGYELFVSPEDAPGLWESVVDAGATPYGTAAADIQRVESGIVVYELDYAPGALTPYDVSWDRLVALDRDFVGRAALEGLADNPPRRTKTLRLEGDEAPEANSPGSRRRASRGNTDESDHQPGLRRHRVGHPGYGECGRRNHPRRRGRTEHRRATVTSLPLYDPERRRPRM